MGKSSSLTKGCLRYTITHWQLICHQVAFKSCKIAEVSTKWVRLCQAWGNLIKRLSCLAMGECWVPNITSMVATSITWVTLTKLQVGIHWEIVRPMITIRTNSSWFYYNFCPNIVLNYFAFSSNVSTFYNLSVFYTSIDNNVVWFYT